MQKVAAAQGVPVTEPRELIEAARELLSDIYQAVAVMMAEVGESDAAWVAADRAAFTAEATGIR